MKTKLRLNTRALIYTIFVLALSSCSKEQTLSSLFRDQTPHQRYAAKLKQANLQETALGQQWLKAADRALQDSVTVNLPFKETGYFAADNPRALGYRFEAKRGQRLIVNLEVKARESLQVFLDLFSSQAGSTSHLASADSTAATLCYEVSEDQEHLLRVQPELLRSGQYTLTIRTEPVLAFPVQGKNSRQISSFWGAARDGGARSHEGVDIFARRGTPALAATAGTVSRVQSTPRGGKVVWVSDTERRQSLYYAHLDAQLVQQGQRVQPGDTIGLIGNTGNARTTGPHLHFGIYRYGHGAVNPYPYLHETGKAVPPVQIDGQLIGNYVRIKPRMANLRLHPDTKSKVYRTLPQHTPLLVLGGTGNWYRVRLPNNTEAYIYSSVVEPARQPYRHYTLQQTGPLLDGALPGAPVKATATAGSRLAVLGSYSSFLFVQQPDGTLGWLHQPEA